MLATKRSLVTARDVVTSSYVAHSFGSTVQVHWSGDGSSTGTVTAEQRL